MPKNTDKKQDKFYQECLRRSKKVLDLKERGIYWQITGTTPPAEDTQDEPAEVILDDTLKHLIEDWRIGLEQLSLGITDDED